MPFVSVFIGIVVAWERMKATDRKHDERLAGHDAELANLQGSVSIIVGTATEPPLFIRRLACEANRAECAVVKHAELEQLHAELESQGRRLDGVQNFARWYLTHESKLSLSEVNKIINGS